MILQATLREIISHTSDFPDAVGPVSITRSFMCSYESEGLILHISIQMIVPRVEYKLNLVIVLGNVFVNKIQSWIAIVAVMLLSY